MEFKAGIPCHGAFITALVSAICLFSTIHALTDGQDVYALNQLYTSLVPSSLSLVGWSPSGGDPCLESWEGVLCAGPNVTILNLTRLNLNGELTPALENLTALIILDLSHNLFVEALPLHLPPHIQLLDLSGNTFTGSIPFSFFALSNLAQLNLSSNLLSGTLIDMWDQFESLQILDLSNNGFDSTVPQSFQKLTSLTQLYLQNNHFSGSINMLADLPLTDLNLSNNELTGWIPLKLQAFPSSSFAGNLFNTFPAPPPPPPPSSPTPLSGGISSSTNEEKPPSASTRKQTTGSAAYLSVGRVIAIAVAGLLASIVVLLIIALLVTRRRQRRKKENYNHKRREEKYGVKESLRDTFFSPKGDKGQPFVLVGNQKDESDMGTNMPRKANEPLEVASLRPPPLPFEGYKPENTQESLNTADASPESAASLKLPPKPFRNLAHRKRKVAQQNSIKAREYSIAELQVATQSFAVENLIGEGTLGKVYKAELCNADEKMVVAVIKKLDYRPANNNKERQGDAEFVELVTRISHVEHPNITRLLGYCVAHGERLLVYDYVSNGSLHDRLHRDQQESTKSLLTWEDRVRIAVGVARALEYLHEKCEPPLFHCNLTSTNILLDDALLPHLSDCGLPPQAYEHASPERLAYSAPESGGNTAERDIYSFGVVMLELLTGRRAFDGSKRRHQQHLVRWAVQQLHDIDAIQRMVDPLISYSAKSLSRFADVISACVQTEPEFRPPMSAIIQDLELLQQIYDMGAYLAGYTYTVAAEIYGARKQCCIANHSHRCQWHVEIITGYNHHEEDKIDYLQAFSLCIYPSSISCFWLLRRCHGALITDLNIVLNHKSGNEKRQRIDECTSSMKTEEKNSLFQFDLGMQAKAFSKGKCTPLWGKTEHPFFSQHKFAQRTSISAGVTVNLSSQLPVFEVGARNRIFHENVGTCIKSSRQLLHIHTYGHVASTSLI